MSYNNSENKYSQDILSAIKFQYDMGVDEFISDNVINRFEAYANAQEANKQKNSTLSSDVKTSSSQGSSNNIDDHKIDSQAGSALIQIAQDQAGNCNSIEELYDVVKNFDHLSIQKTATNTVFSCQNTDADIMIISDIPQSDEDISGKPLKGKAGKLFDEMALHAGLNREDSLYITSPIFWRPPGGRRPTKQEIDICRVFVIRQIQLVKPKKIIILGNVGYNSLYKENKTISSIQGKVTCHKIDGVDDKISILTTLSPYQMMQNPMKKKLLWFDLLLS